MTKAARRWAYDAGLAAVATGADLALALAQPHWQGRASGSPNAFGIALVIAAGGALLARRRYPGIVLGIALVATLGAGLLGAQGGWLALVIAFFNAMVRGRRVAAIASLVAGYGASAWNSSAQFALLLLAGLISLLSIAELSRALNARAAADRRERAEAAARRASQERLAIARDLHDVVAHSVSVINVQANTALHLMDRQPERAREALTSIREVSGQALAEFAAVLGALRDADGATDGGAPLAPVPGVARLDELAERARSAGFEVSVAASGPVRQLPAGVDAAAYRIVQEALTNTVRHSDGRTASVLLRYGDGDLEIEVADDGGGALAARDGRVGNGLAGMAERARALGGSLDAGPRPDGGFLVQARLPV
ncbi:MAG TPA: histidine kinase [Trebonia sp.]